MPLEVLGYVASFAFLVRLVPQPVRLWRTGVPDGVSPMGAWNNVLSDLGWAVYGVTAGLPPVVVMAVLSQVPGTMTAVQLRRSATRHDVIGAAAWAGILVLSYLGGFLGVALTVSMVVIYGPQVVAALRTAVPRGIAPSTYLLGLVDAALWGTYGFLVADATLLGYAAVLSLASALILGRLWWARRALTVSPVEAVPGLPPVAAELPS